MNSLPFANINGELLPSSNPVLTINNRAFSYGDALFETIHANGTEAQFIDLHVERISKSAKTLGYILPPSFDVEFVQREIRRLAQKNKYYLGSRLRLSLFRNHGGLYTPTNNNCSFTLEQTTLPYWQYRLNDQGLRIGLFEDIKKPLNSLSTLKSANALLFVLAGMHKTKEHLDDCLLINEKRNIAEAISSNIFVLINDKLVTPPVSEGCLPGIMRFIISSIAKSIKINIEERPVTTEILQSANEVFLTNAISGIRWVMAYGEKRYFNETAKRLIVLLNKVAFSE